MSTWKCNLFGHKWEECFYILDTERDIRYIYRECVHCHASQIEARECNAVLLQLYASIVGEDAR